MASMADSRVLYRKTNYLAAIIAVHTERDRELFNNVLELATMTDAPVSRAGKILASHNLWFREVPQEDRNENVCKTICFKRKDGVIIAAVVPYMQRVSYKKLKMHYQMDVQPLSPDELRAIGFEPHECAPMLMTCEVLIDPQCTTKEPIQTGSGTIGYGIEWHFSDLTTIKEYTIFDCSEER